MLQSCFYKNSNLLRNHINFLILLQFERNLSTGVPKHGPNKQASAKNQAKVMGKLFGNRVAGSKKRWYPSNEISAAQSAIFSSSQIIKPIKQQGKNITRRMTVLNKLFMKHITDLLATGEASEKILGRGLQITSVKITSDFAGINVFWLSSGETVDNDAELEQELQRCSGLLRHELSQLCLMGEVPRIHFVRDKKHINLTQVDQLLRNMDFGDHAATDMADTVREDFHWKDVRPLKTHAEEPSIEDPVAPQAPEMRHDVLGLDQRSIMLKIISKMRKSKQAWEQHHTTSEESLNNNGSVNDLTSINQKLISAATVQEQFDKFLSKRRERKYTPERKKFQLTDHATNMQTTNPILFDQSFVDNQWKEEDDFIEEEQNEKQT